MIFRSMKELSVVVAMGLAPAAWSQQAVPQGNSGVDQLDEVVVTASKRKQRLLDVSGAISVQSGDDIDARRAQNMEALFAVEPGVSFQKTSPEQSFPVIRGISTGSALNLVTVPVGIYFGDVPVSDPQNPQSVIDATPIDMETVEILKGPQGSLYGANSLAGAVRYVFRRPDLDSQFSGNVDVSVSDVADASTGYRVSGVLNLASSEGKAGVRVVGWSSNSPGYVDNVSAGVTGASDSENYGFRGTALWKPTDKLTVTLIGLSQRSTIDDAYFIDDPRGEVLTRTGNPTLSPSGLRTSFGNLVLEYALSDSLTLTSNTGYLDKKRSLRTDYTNSGLFCVNFLGLFGLPISVPYCESESYASGEQFFQEIRLSGQVGSRLDFVAGASYQTAETDIGGPGPGGISVTSAPGFSAQIAPFLPPGTTPAQLGPTDAYLTGKAIQKNKESSVFAEAEIKLSDAVALTVGGRFWRNESELPTQFFGGYYSFLFFNPGSFVYSNTYPKSTEDGFTPKVAVRFRLNEEQSIYAVASRGYRFGGVNVIPDPGQTVQGKYDTDTLWNYEVGYRGRPVESLDVDAAVYFMDWEDAQIQVTGVDNFQRVLNAGKARVKGAEFGIGWRVTEQFRLRAAAAFNDAEITEALVLTPLSTVPAGTELPGTPELSTSLSAEYSFTGPFGSSGFAVLTHSHVGKSYFDIEQTAEIGGYDVVDARVSFTRGKVQYSAFATNLTDERAATGVVTFPAVSYAVLQPRTLGIGVRFEF
jgi:outer membrane receptor protein involved in Fe transport